MVTQITAVSRAKIQENNDNKEGEEDSGMHFASAVGWTYLEWVLEKRSKIFAIQAELYSYENWNLNFKREKNSEQAWRAEQSHFQGRSPWPFERL